MAFLKASPSPNRFETFRQQHGLSIRNFAKVFGISRTSAHRLCTGEPDASFVNNHRPQMEQAARAFLAGRMLSREGIAQALAALFQTEDSMIIPRCELTRPAMKFFGLKKDAFSFDPENEGEYFVSPELEKVLDRVELAIEKRRFIALIGEVGSGKTALRHRIQVNSADDPRQRIIWLESADYEEMRFSDLTTLILLELGHAPKRIKIERGFQLTRVLRELNQSGITVTLAIEEAHRLNDRALSALKLFWEKGQPQDGGYNRYLGVVLFGQPQLEGRLQSHQFSEVVQRLQIVTMPRFEKQAGDYLGHRLAAVGGDLGALFTPEAVAEIAGKASTPLALGNLANAALMEAYALRERKVQAGMLEVGSEPRLRAVRRAR